MKQHEMIAMLLAGGKGTRLQSLTKAMAKPAVNFGAKYRIIDFALSSIANSGIDTVGILSQYESVALNTYIGNGSKWGIDGNKSITTMLPPREKEEGANWYKGTADAIYQNLDFVKSQGSQYVLILSGDTIFKMDFDDMLNFHKEMKADVTISCQEVKLEEASRFGIILTDENNKVLSFEEKPKNPKSLKASMGIYIFNYSVLREVLLSDAKDEKSSHDFGKDIIPKLIARKKNIYVYNFQGYWKDVGTIQSLYQANMDLLDPNSLLGINDLTHKIYSEDTHSLPIYCGPESFISRSFINQGAIIKGKSVHSVIFTDVVIEDGAEVSDCVIMQNTKILKGVKLKNCLVAPDLVVTQDQIPINNELLFVDK